MVGTPAVIAALVTISQCYSILIPGESTLLSQAVTSESHNLLLFLTNFAFIFVILSGIVAILSLLALVCSFYENGKDFQLGTCLVSRY